MILKMNFRTIVALGIACSGQLLAQTSTSDCAGAIELCGGVYTESTAPLGTGSVYEFTGTCNQNNETASLWYTFTVQEAGDLSFILDPANDADDYDWGLFNITNGGCAGINAQDGSSPEVNCNSYGEIGTNGPTGISSTNGGTGTSNGPGNLNGPTFNADLPVVVGQTYALVVMNWSGSLDGYAIDFTQSTASLYDQVPPVPVSVELDCTNQTFRLEFSEQVVTSTVQPTDFSILTPSGGTVGVSVVNPDQPSAFAQAGFTLVLSAALLEPGTHTLSVTAVSGNVEDPCGNIVVDTLFQFEVVAPLSIDVTTTTACNGSNGTLLATHSAGGAEPIIFTLAGMPLPSGSATGLDAGPYTLQAEDANGCVITEVVNVPDHVLDVQVPQVQDSLSCAKPSIVIEGVQVVPEQVVQYAWTAVTDAGTDPAFSTSASPEVAQPGIYTVLVTETQSGCTDETSVVIVRTTAPVVDLRGIQLPNVVTPNGDGKNDLWRPYVTSDPTRDITPLFDTYALTIFDRWGRVAYDTEGGGSRTWSAGDADEGTYFYTVAYRTECGTVVDEERAGSITVLR